MIDEQHGGTPRPNGWRAGMWATILVLLVCPLVAMQFTEEVKWDAADFVAAAALLGGFGIVVELARRLPVHFAVRVAGVGIALLAVLLIWADAAVGVF